MPLSPIRNCSCYCCAVPKGEVLQELQHQNTHERGDGVLDKEAKPIPGNAASRPERSGRGFALTRVARIVRHPEGGLRHEQDKEKNRKGMTMDGVLGCVPPIGQCRMPPPKPGGRDGVIVPQMPFRMPMAMLPRMLTRKAMKRASLAESHRISPALVDISSAGRFDRKLAGVGDAESAGINSGWRNLSAKENQGASINNHTACNASFFLETFPGPRGYCFQRGGLPHE